jgi:flagellin
MVTGNSMMVAYGRISTFNKVNENTLASSLMSLASGKRVREPKDNIPDYFHAQRLNNQARDYSRIAQDLSETSAMMDVASDAAESVFTGLERMRDLVDLYYDNNSSTDEKTAYKAEFNSLVKQVSHIVDNTNYGGRSLISDSSAKPLANVSLDPNNQQSKFTITFSSQQVADVAELTLGSGESADASAIQAELEKAGSYLAKLSGYKRGLDAQYNIVNKKVDLSTANRNNLTDVDSGTEMVLATNKSIRHQTSLSMMAQANVMGSSILKLFA